VVLALLSVPVTAITPPRWDGVSEGRIAFFYSYFIKFIRINLIIPLLLILRTYSSDAGLSLMVSYSYFRSSLSSPLLSL
jgi:hypothetical protein